MVTLAITLLVLTPPACLFVWCAAQFFIVWMTPMPSAPPAWLVNSYKAALMRRELIGPSPEHYMTYDEILAASRPIENRATHGR